MNERSFLRLISDDIALFENKAAIATKAK